MEVRVMSARTVEEAIELALKELDVDRDEAEVEILSRGKSGFLGIGAELARVRVTKISGGGNAAALATEAVSKILQAAGVNVSRTLRAANDPEVGGPIIDLTGEDSGLLIGRRGQTLQALQFLVNLIVRKELGENVRVLLDVERYRQRRETSLRDMATKVAARVAQSNRSITLEPMPPADRRIVHTTLTDHPGVTTESTGVGDGRKVTISPKPNQ
ncbi:MAG: protein jag [Chloroflexi bacterium]|nr:protein jag [Chloroflexota bacterium]MCH8349251.1 protein jag [Chloroflexota bacterium]MCI0780873.1 protein jag [Chloroflexota bacterium]MCI0792368.1 protein jag [Chloroflexota bacterium]MCI0798614.1 protein jag [Chloroflexota bacterium]